MLARWALVSILLLCGCARPGIAAGSMASTVGDALCAPTVEEFDHGERAFLQPATPVRVVGPVEGHEEEASWVTVSGGAFAGRMVVVRTSDLRPLP